jgi:TatD DNase family protein
MYIDSHTHFDFCLKKSADIFLTEEKLTSGLNENNIKYAVQVSTEVNEFEWSYSFAKRNSNILFTLGIHPSSKADESELKTLYTFLKHVLDYNDRRLLLGIGETGLDYYRMHQPKTAQMRSFEFQIVLADEFNLPLIIHSREATEDTLKILKEKNPKQPIMHCFAGDSKAAKSFLDLGCMISFAGNITYKSANDLRDAAAFVPLDRLLLETDAPFLTPVPLRGQQNKPDNIIHTYKFLAELRKEKLSIMAENIFNNFISLISLTGN